MNEQALPDIPGLEARPNAPVGKMTSMGVACTARALVTAESNDALAAFLEWAAQAGQPFYVMGGGTNIVFCDEYYSGIVIRLGQAFHDVKIHDEMIRAGCSIQLSRLLSIVTEQNLSGLEFIWGIPGTLGGGIIGNAGSAAESLCQVVEAVKGFDAATGATFGAKRGGFEFGYRYCSLRGMILTEAVLRLEKSDFDTIQERLKHPKTVRHIQPAGVRSAGCIFKNPPNDSAGRLIDTAGLKGFAIGGAVVSTEHANFIVNRNKASASDILGLIDHVRQRVREAHGLELELEVQLRPFPLGASGGSFAGGIYLTPKCGDFKNNSGSSEDSAARPAQVQISASA